jgi:hypothetical protein
MATLFRGVAPDFSSGERAFKPAENVRHTVEGFSPGVRNLLSRTTFSVCMRTGLCIQGTILAVPKTIGNMTGLASCGKLMLLEGTACLAAASFGPYITNLKSLRLKPRRAGFHAQSTFSAACLTPQLLHLRPCCLIPASLLSKKHAGYLRTTPPNSSHPLRCARPPPQLSEIGHQRPGLNKPNPSCVDTRDDKPAHSTAKLRCAALVTGMH